MSILLLECLHFEDHTRVPCIMIEMIEFMLYEKEPYVMRVAFSANQLHCSSMTIKIDVKSRLSPYFHSFFYKAVSTDAFVRKGRQKVD